jgi:hypothetical protein
MRAEVAQMESVLPGLYASTPQQLPFDHSLDIRAFLLERGQGNLLVYSIGSLATDAETIEDLGGVSRQYLNHWHEALFGCGWVGRRFGAPLVCHESDRPSVSERCTVDETFSGRHALDEDFEVIPIPGHTPGTTAFLWDSGQHRCLFTGDTIYLREGEWVAALLGSSERRLYIESLEMIRELDFDVLVPWAATSGQPYRTIASKADAQSRIDAILERLRRGEDH